jgi:hypothetical protein
LETFGNQPKKQTLAHPKAEVAARNCFEEKIDAYQNANQKIVYIDESGFAHDRPRRNGYALVGKRCVGQHHWHARGRLNVVGALLVSCWLTVSLFTGSINANTFYAWVAQNLLPQLPPPSVIIMDDAAFHQRADLRQLIELAGHLLEYLPAYSPDLNPIERQSDLSIKKWFG